MIFIKTFILAIAFYIFFRSIRIIFNILPLKAAIRVIIFRSLPVLEMLLWIGFSYWAVQQLFSDQVILTVIKACITVIIIIIFAWYLFRDLIAGVILKTENTFKAGQSINTPSISGIIDKIGGRTLKVINDNDESVEIPFSRIIGQEIVISSNKEKKTGHTFRFNVSSKHQPVKIKELVKRRILEIPWIISNDEINLNLIREGADNFILEVRLHTISNDLIYKTEELLKNFIQEVF